MYGKPHRLADVFAKGEIGFIDFSSSTISVVPGSVSFEMLTYPGRSNGHDLTLHAYCITCEDGTVHQLPARWVRRIGRVVINPDTQLVRWADEDGQ